MSNRFGIAKYRRLDWNSLSSAELLEHAFEADSLGDYEGAKELRLFARFKEKRGK